jgi:hydroxyacylglutathione hydrolase
VGPNVEVVETAELGDRSYVVHDGSVAVVVDPQRDLDRVERVLAGRDLRCRLVLETHIHNDYVTGGFELARRSGARYGVAAGEAVSFGREPLADGVEREVGNLRVRAVATPGHTDHHLSYVVEDGDGPAAVFTGGSLLYGSTGRPDLLGPQHTDALAHAQWHSARRLAAELPDTTAVYPTHGFGSFCSAPTAPTSSPARSSIRPAGSPAWWGTRRGSSRRTGSGASAPPARPRAGTAARSARSGGATTPSWRRTKSPSWPASSPG